MRKLLFTCLAFLIFFQVCTAQLSRNETARLLQSTFLRECSTMQHPKVEKKGEKLFFNPIFEVQVQRILPSFGYMRTSVSAEELPYFTRGEEVFLDINIQQFAGQKRLKKWEASAVRRDEKIFIVSGGGLAFRSCPDSLFINGVKTAADFETLVRLKFKNPGKILLTKDDESEVRFSKYDEMDELWSDIYFPDRNPNNLKRAFYKTVYGKPTSPDTTRIAADDVMNLVMNSLLQNIILTRIARDSVLLAQLVTASKQECPNTDGLPLPIIPAYDEVLTAMAVVPYGYATDEVILRTNPFYSPSGMKETIYWEENYARMNGYQLYFVARAKDSNFVYPVKGGRASGLARELGNAEPAVIPHESKNWPDGLPLPPPRPAAIPEIVLSRGNYFINEDYELYLVGYNPQKEEILFLAGEDICLHQDIYMYAPKEKPYLPFAKWPKSNQIEFIHDKLLPMRPQELTLSDVTKDSNIITGTVSVLDKGTRVLRTFVVNLDEPYLVKFD